MEKLGRIVKGIAGFYYVHTADDVLYECKAKGSFRNDKKKPLVGDFVQIRIVDEETRKGNVEQIKERSSELLRPAVANVDQALVIFALKDPEPNFHMLDTFLARMELQKIPSLICFNKTDLDADGSLQEQIRSVYENTQYPLFFTSAQQGRGIEALRQQLEGRCTTVAGPSGAGKSSLVNLLQEQVQMETSSISQKTARGKHTTRHSELIMLGSQSYIMDTPGFTSLRMDDYEKEDIARGFVEIEKFEENCRFAGCSHIQEPNCGVKEALSRGEISRQRYDSYVMMYEECKEKRRY